MAAVASRPGAKSHLETLASAKYLKRLVGRSWHEGCNAFGIGGANGSGRRNKARITIMTTRFQSAQRVIVSFVGALFFAAIAVGTAVPVLPVA